MANDTSVPQTGARNTPSHPPVLKPSLIPFDVLKAWELEQQHQAQIETERPNADVFAAFGENQEPPTLGHGLANQAPADLAVARVALSQVRLLSGLPSRSLDALAHGAVQGEVKAGQMLFCEGDVAKSFFVVVDGTLEIVRQRDDKEVVLRHASSGEALGLMGLFSGQLRAASVRAIGDATVIEVSGDSLQRVLNRDTALADRLFYYYQARLVEGFLGSSRIFNDIDSIVRGRLLGRFSERRLDAGECLLQPGEVINALAIVVQGHLLLEDKPRAGQQQFQYEVNQGQFVAVTGALSGNPSRLRIFADKPCTLSILSHKELSEMIREYPALRQLPTRLHKHAKMLERDVFCGHTRLPGL